MPVNLIVGNDVLYRCSNSRSASTKSALNNRVHDLTVATSLSATFQSRT